MYEQQIPERGRSKAEEVTPRASNEFAGLRRKERDRLRHNQPVGTRQTGRPAPYATRTGGSAGRGTPRAHERRRLSMAKRRGNNEGSIYRRKDGYWVGQYGV